MKFVIDSNVLISALISDSVTRELILEMEEEFYSPDFLESEIEKHKDLIQEKSDLTSTELDSLLTILIENIFVAAEETYENKINIADEAIGDTDKKDVPFLALALEKDAAIWSDDRHFDDQDKVEVWKTEDMVTEFFEKDS